VNADKGVAKRRRKKGSGINHRWDDKKSDVAGVGKR